MGVIKEKQYTPKESLSRLRRMYHMQRELLPNPEQTFEEWLKT